MFFHNKMKRKLLSIDTVDSFGNEQKKQQKQYESSFAEEEREISTIFISLKQAWNANGYNITPSFEREQTLLPLDSNVEDSSLLISSKNTPREVALEGVLKALTELTQLQSLTGQLATSNTSLSLRAVQRQSIQKKGISLPAAQVIQNRRQDLSSSIQTLQVGINQSVETIQQRQRYAAAVFEIRRFWRLVLLPSRIAFALLAEREDNARLIALSRQPIIAVDCSLSNAGATPSSSLHYLPLLIGDNGPVLTAFDCSHHYQTIRLSIRRRHGSNSNSDFNIGDIKTLASVTAWEASQIAAEFLPRPPIQSHLHEQIQYRHHETFCSSLFACIKDEVVHMHDRWVSTYPLLSSKPSLLFPHQPLAREGSACPVDKILEVTSMERNEVVMTLMHSESSSSFDSLEVAIQLESIPVPRNERSCNGPASARSTLDVDDNIIYLRKCLCEVQLLFVQGLEQNSLGFLSSSSSKYSLVDRENLRLSLSPKCNDKHIISRHLMATLSDHTWT